jgi:hypothetical protein
VASQSAAVGFALGACADGDRADAPDTAGAACPKPAAGTATAYEAAAVHASRDSRREVTAD